MILAIDPGTQRCGVAVLDAAGATVICRALVPPKRQMALERIWWLHNRFEEFAGSYLADGPGVDVAIEHLTGAGVPPAPELDFLCAHLERWAERHHWRFFTYRPQEWREVAQWMGTAARTKADVERWALAVCPALRAVRDGPGGMDALEAYGIGQHHYSIARIERAAKGRR